MRAIIDMRFSDSDIDEGRLEELVSFMAEQLTLPEGEVSLSFVDNGEMQALNARYRGINAPTDVLSFECDGIDDAFPCIEGEGIELGDIVVAPLVARDQANHLGSSCVEEIDLLVTHGMLHLCGYDHIEDDEAQRMEALQSDLLAAWRTYYDGNPVEIIDA